MHFGTWDDPLILLDRSIGKMVFLWIHAGVFYYKTGAANERPANPTDGIILPDAAAVAAMISAAGHTRLHSIISTLDHSSAATAGKMLKADASGLPIEATNTDTAVAAAVAASHAEAHALSAHSAAVADLDIGGYKLLNPAGIFGAAGNCVLDASKFATLAAAIAALPAAGGELYLPAATVSVTASIVIDKPVVIRGIDTNKNYANIGQSIIQAEGNVSSPIFDIRQTGSLYLEGLTFQCSSASATNWGIAYTTQVSASAVMMRRCKVLGYKFRYVLNTAAVGVYYLNVRDIYAEVWGWGFFIGNEDAIWYPHILDHVIVALPSSPAAASVCFIVVNGYPNVTGRHPTILSHCIGIYGGATYGAFRVVPNRKFILNCCEAITSKGNGLTIEGYGSIASGGVPSIYKFLAVDCEKNGIWVGGSATGTKACAELDACEVYNCGRLGAGYDGIRVNSYVSGLWARNNRVYSDGTYQDNAINFSSGTGVTIDQLVNNSFQGGFKAGGAAIKFYSAAQRQAIKSYSGNIADTVIYAV